MHDSRAFLCACRSAEIIDRTCAILRITFFSAQMIFEFASPYVNNFLQGYHGHFESITR
jgi:hypothetical protein